MLTVLMMKELNLNIVMIEVWKDIKGYEGLYQVSNIGRVKSLTRTNCRKENILKQTNRGNGYYCVSLSKNNIVKTFCVHRLVAEAFIPNPNNFPCVNHINEDKLDNRVENLEFCTIQYNSSYGSVCQRLSQIHTNRTDMSKPVLQYDLEGNFIKEWPSTREIERILGYNNAFISGCCRNINH